MIGAAASRAAALGTATAELRAAGVDAPRRDARLLMQHALGLTPEALLAEDGVPLTANEAAQLGALVRRRAAREPIAYLTGRREFWSLDFAVDRSALVPRPESETLVEAVLDHAPRLPTRPRLLDLGTGTGCLLVALLSELTGAAGLGIDISAAAVSLARANARRHGLGERASFAVADWGVPLAACFDIVVSNPPYVAAPELASLAPEIVRHEPREALAGGNDGYASYRQLAPQITKLLAPRGLAAIELGDGMADEVAALFASAGLVEIGRRRDLAGMERCALFARNSTVELRSGENLIPLPQRTESQKRGCKLRDDR